MAPVPEPSTYVLAVAAVGALGLVARKRKLAHAG
ncbi:MAG: PEP-CTERM sorting domain-containing protein [bacterium]